MKERNGMTEQEAKWFEELAKDRADSANVLNKQSMRGVHRSVTNKYTGQAHFIYELLQNANDVKATSARFRLQRDGLLFFHNGTIPFSISDPNQEDRDTANGTLGHINSITSIANSNKNESSIGKFGIGFKAVFLYTHTPHIYDPCFRFKIDRLIVPIVLAADLPNRQPNETVFWFPFDHSGKSHDECFSDIFHKLNTLDHPALFLTNLRDVSFEAEDTFGIYEKQSSTCLRTDDITCERLRLSFLREDESQRSDELLLFTRTNTDGNTLRVGFGVADDALVPRHANAYCFFQTREQTNLKFIVHAPFLLTDSREGITAGESHNVELIQQLARLAADSLAVLCALGLIRDTIFDIIPYRQSDFGELGDRNKISFRPVFLAIRHALETQALLPTNDGVCVAKERAFWGSDPELLSLFSSEQLEILTGVAGARWVLPTRCSKDVQRSSSEFYMYIEPLLQHRHDPESLLRMLTSQFISLQSRDWLHSLYSYLSDRKSYWSAIKDKPIFLDDSGKPAAAFDTRRRPTLFFSDEDMSGYPTIHPDLLCIENTREFVTRLGVAKPNLRADVDRRILPKYTDGSVAPPDAVSDFRALVRCFKECADNERAEFVDQLRETPFVVCYFQDSPDFVCRLPKDCYFPTQHMKAWFESQPTVPFVILDKYVESLESADHELCVWLLREVGVNSHPRILRHIDKLHPQHDPECLRSSSGSNHSYEHPTIEGSQRLLSMVDDTRSHLLWDVLTELPNIGQLVGKYTWKNNVLRSKSFVSLEQHRLRTTKWLVSPSDELVSPSNVTVDELAKRYNVHSAGAQALIKFLAIREAPVQSTNLTADQVRLINLGKRQDELGLTEDEIVAILDARKRKQQALSAVEFATPATVSATFHPALPIVPQLGERVATQHAAASTSAPSVDMQPANPSLAAAPQDETSDDDTDDYAPKPVDYSKKIDGKKTKQASEIRGLELQQSLYDTASRASKYSFGWVTALWELECLESNSKHADAKTVSISFGKVTRDEESARTLRLSQPSGYIPQAIEEMSGVPVVLTFADGTTSKLRIEAFTAKEFELFGKLASADDLKQLAQKGLSLDAVVEARVEVKSPAFLDEALLNGLRLLAMRDDFCMKTELPKNIEFVFGPPGTGKTTHLAEKVLMPRMRSGTGSKVLVLTPTNKAADVLTHRIMEKMAEDTSYRNWLVRFGSCADERIEEAGVVRPRDFDVGSLRQSITVTTIARFAYDGFTHNGGKKLAEMKWDLIVIDEASMISLASVLYPLYKQSPEKFIIAGDPFQIEPIVANATWKDENIYTMVGLAREGSFKHPQTEPHRFQVTPLTTQYRSVPAIGQLFSSFTYDGVLKHSRAASSGKPFALPGLDVKPLNLITFPVSKYESVYRAKKLKSGTSYQTYSALLTFELVRWLGKSLGANEGAARRVGVISPYRAQTNLISKLVDSWHSKPSTIHVHVGTTHGFQGDECDIIVAVLNPPARITNNSQMFLNKQNMLNVAISRARDYLFLLVPDDKTENIADLRKVKRLCTLIRNSKDDHVEYSSSSIERLIWNDAKYIEANTFSTGHQMVNVYREAQRKYEVRSDDAAIDVQIHDE
jgi:hypothetical protein